MAETVSTSVDDGWGDVEEGDFMGRLENLWAWDAGFWDLMFHKGVPSLSNEQMECARISIVKKLRNIESIIAGGMSKSEAEKKHNHLKGLKKLINGIRINIEYLNNTAIRSKSNLRRVKAYLRYMLVEIVEIQKLRGQTTDGIPIDLNDNDIPDIKARFHEVFDTDQGKCDG
jgi:hypothetical protein